MGRKNQNYTRRLDFAACEDRESGNRPVRHEAVDPRRNRGARGAGHGGERRDRQAGILAKRAEDAAVKIVHLYKLSHAGCDMRKL